MAPSRAQVPFTVLNYLLTRAVTEGKNETATIRVPYVDLLATIGKVVETEEDKQNSELDLVVNISLEWEQHSDDENEAVDIDVEFTPDTEFES